MTFHFRIHSLHIVVGGKIFGCCKFLRTKDFSMISRDYSVHCFAFTIHPNTKQCAL